MNNDAMAELDAKIQKHTSILEGRLQEDSSNPYGTWKEFVSGINELRQKAEDARLQSDNKVFYKALYCTDGGSYR